MFVQDRGVEQVFAQWGPDFRIDLHHEGTHALLHASLARVPLWLDEGLAKYFEVPPAQRANGNPYLPIVEAGADTARFPARYARTGTRRGRHGSAQNIARPGRGSILC